MTCSKYYILLVPLLVVLTGKSASTLGFPSSPVLETPCSSTSISRTNFQRQGSFWPAHLCGEGDQAQSTLRLRGGAADAADGAKLLEDTNMPATETTAHKQVLLKARLVDDRDIVSVYNVSTSAGDTVLSVKRQLQSLTGLEVADQRLVFRGKMLKDNLMVHEYDGLLTPGALFQIVPRSGMKGRTGRGSDSAQSGSAQQYLECATGAGTGQGSDHRDEEFYDRQAALLTNLLLAARSEVRPSSPRTDPRRTPARAPMVLHLPGSASSANLVTFRLNETSSDHQRTTARALRLNSGSYGGLMNYTALWEHARRGFSSLTGSLSSRSVASYCRRNIDSLEIGISTVASTLRLHLLPYRDALRSFIQDYFQSSLQCMGVSEGGLSDIGADQLTEVAPLLDSTKSSMETLRERLDLLKNAVHVCACHNTTMGSLEPREVGEIEPAEGHCEFTAIYNPIEMGQGDTSDTSDARDISQSSRSSETCTQIECEDEACSGRRDAIQQLLTVLQGSLAHSENLMKDLGALVTETDSRSWVQNVTT